MNAPSLPFTRTPHLVALVAEAERLATILAGAPPDDRAAVREGALQAAAVATLRLDGSPVTAPPTIPDDLDLAPIPAPDDRSTWLDTLALAAGADADDATPEEAAVDELLRALEYLGARAALEADDLADAMGTDLVGALTEVHRRLTRGLVAPEAVGRLRASDQAVHDASQGRILFYAPDPARIPDRLAHLAAWTASAGAREHALLVSGVVHLDLLALHPFEAANGRLARAAARLVLRSRGLDPDGLAAPEPVLGEDPIGYYEEVGRTNRRRDLTIWLERWGEAVVEGLRRAARGVGRLGAAVPERAADFVAARPDPAFTIADYRAEAGVGPEEARADLEALLDAGRIARVPATRGLRYTVT